MEQPTDNRRTAGDHLPTACRQPAGSALPGGCGRMRAMPRPKPALRRPSPLVLGSAANGLLAYVFFALVTHALGGTRAAPVSVLWSWWSFAAAARLPSAWVTSAKKT